ncbi:hypothetical protein [Vibrio intestinalis]|uniref:hypothetical protein n=1 Tax=Vibrio intestinalis TaxID=2933291 RepID=UPI00242FEFC0|nr:hypothetical protein [Vibrio intestinalis]
MKRNSIGLALQHPTIVRKQFTKPQMQKSRNISIAAFFNMVGEEEFDRTGVPDPDHSAQAIHQTADAKKPQYFYCGFL